VLFSVYVRSFADYSRTYGAVAAVVALLMWFYLSSFTIVLGAQINAEMDRLARQRRDLTVAPS
jgi:membrane protein